MKILFFLLCFSSAIAQQTVYQSFEADSAAEPRGGVITFNTFVQTNLRKPVLAAAKGIGGRVIISAIVEPNGSVSDVKAANSLRPDCDREAIRVFSLFKAWKPALKGGKAVRQQITTTILFKPNAPFIYRNGAHITYYDSDRKALADSSELARYKQESPLDSNGFANGDIVVYKGKGGNWKEEYWIPFVRQVNKPQNLSDQPTILSGYQNGNKMWEGEVVMRREDGTMVYRYSYKNGRLGNEGIHYNSNGQVSEKREEVEGGFTATSWYDNGQIREIRLNRIAKPKEIPIPSSVMAFWASTGQQLVKDGNGKVINKERVLTQSAFEPRLTLTEEGAYENGLKQGRWTGHYDDNSFFYTEDYNKGICIGGKSKRIEEDTLYYTEVEKQPEFKGGMKAFGSFLSGRLRYPDKAQKANLEGQVILSFIVDTNGHIEEATVIESLGLGTDEEALRVLNASSGLWQPGYQRGKKVRVKYRMPINFSLR